MIIQIISAFFAVYMFTMLLDIPKQFAHYSGTIGAVGWFVYFTRHGQGYSPMMAAFASTLVIALFSHILARVKKAPVTVFLVAGILPLVPGAQIYRCVFNLIQNDFDVSNFYLIEALQIAGAIAMAVFIMDSIFKLVQAYSENRRKARL